MPFSYTADHRNSETGVSNDIPIETKIMYDKMDAIDKNLDKIKSSLQSRYSQLVSAQIDRLREKEREMTPKQNVLDESDLGSENKTDIPTGITRIRIRQYKQFEINDEKFPQGINQTKYANKIDNNCYYPRITFRQTFIKRKSPEMSSVDGISDTAKSIKTIVPHPIEIDNHTNEELDLPRAFEISESTAGSTALSESTYESNSFVMVRNISSSPTSNRSFKVSVSNVVVKNDEIDSPLSKSVQDYSKEYSRHLESSQNRLNSPLRDIAMKERNKSNWEVKKNRELYRPKSPNLEKVNANFSEYIKNEPKDYKFSTLDRVSPKYANHDGDVAAFKGVPRYKHERADSPVGRKLKKMVERLEDYNDSVLARMEFIKQSPSPQRSVLSKYAVPAITYKDNGFLETDEHNKQSSNVCLDRNLVKTEESSGQNIYASSRSPDQQQVNRIITLENRGKDLHSRSINERIIFNKAKSIKFENGSIDVSRKTWIGDELDIKNDQQRRKPEADLNKPLDSDERVRFLRDTIKDDYISDAHQPKSVLDFDNFPQFSSESEMTLQYQCSKPSDKSEHKSTSANIENVSSKGFCVHRKMESQPSGNEPAKCQLNENINFSLSPNVINDFETGRHQVPTDKSEKPSTSTQHPSILISGQYRSPVFKSEDCSQNYKTATQTQYRAPYDKSEIPPMMADKIPTKIYGQYHLPLDKAAVSTKDEIRSPVDQYEIPKLLAENESVKCQGQYRPPVHKKEAPNLVIHNGDETMQGRHCGRTDGSKAPDTKKERFQKQDGERKVKAVSFERYKPFLTEDPYLNRSPNNSETMKKRYRRPPKPENLPPEKKASDENLDMNKMSVDVRKVPALQLQQELSEPILRGTRGNRMLDSSQNRAVHVKDKFCEYNSKRETTDDNSLSDKNEYPSNRNRKHFITSEINTMPLGQNNFEPNEDQFENGEDQTSSSIDNKIKFALPYPDQTNESGVTSQFNRAFVRTSVKQSSNNKDYSVSVGEPKERVFNKRKSQTSSPAQVLAEKLAEPSEIGKEHKLPSIQAPYPLSKYLSAADQSDESSNNESNMFQNRSADERKIKISQSDKEKIAGYFQSTSDAYVSKPHSSIENDPKAMHTHQRGQGTSTHQSSFNNGKENDLSYKESDGKREIYKSNEPYDKIEAFIHTAGSIRLQKALEEPFVYPQRIQDSSTISHEEISQQSDNYLESKHKNKEDGEIRHETELYRMKIKEDDQCQQKDMLSKEKLMRKTITATEKSISDKDNDESDSTLKGKHLPFHKLLKQHIRMLRNTDIKSCKERDQRTLKGRVEINDVDYGNDNSDIEQPTQSYSKSRNSVLPENKSNEDDHKISTYGSHPIEFKQNIAPTVKERDIDSQGDVCKDLKPVLFSAADHSSYSNKDYNQDFKASHFSEENMHQMKRNRDHDNTKADIPKYQDEKNMINFLDPKYNVDGNNHKLKTGNQQEDGVPACLNDGMKYQFRREKQPRDQKQRKMMPSKPKEFTERNINEMIRNENSNEGRLKSLNKFQNNSGKENESRIINSQSDITKESQHPRKYSEDRDGHSITKKSKNLEHAEPFQELTGQTTRKVNEYFPMKSMKSNIQSKHSTGSQTAIIQGAEMVLTNVQSSQTEVHITPDRKEYVEDDGFNIYSDSVESARDKRRGITAYANKDGNKKLDNGKSEDDIESIDDEFSHFIRKAVPKNVHRLQEDIERVLSTKDLTTQYNSSKADDGYEAEDASEADDMILARIETLLSLCNASEDGEYSEPLKRILGLLRHVYFYPDGRSRENIHMDEMNTVLKRLADLTENNEKLEESMSGENIVKTTGEDTETEKELFDSTASSMSDKMTTDQIELNGYDSNRRQFINAEGNALFRRQRAFLKRNLHLIVLGLGIITGIAIVLLGPSAAKMVYNFIISCIMNVICNFRLVQPNPPIT